MKTIGLIGGMSWESSAHYYRIINEEVRAALGGSHSARILMYSYDFHEIERMQRAGEWEAMRISLFDVGKRLKAGGADFAVLCTNTMHKVMDGFEDEVGIPLLHIVDVAGEALASFDIKRIGLLGTRFTMEENFYSARLKRGFDIDVLVPDAPGRATVDRIIFQELVRGILRDESRDAYRTVMDSLVARGAEAILLGCTEIGLLITDYSAPLFDTTPLHARRSALLSLE
ncbi:MAG TPA: aspartate/glutamate racemase family protein [bacterium]|nr:aspartate/glutamate racemase family protein [bacterium]